MKYIFQVFCLFALFFALQTLDAAPYAPEGLPFQIQDVTGTERTIRVFGDEFYAWYESEEGYTLLQDPVTQEWRYATLNASNELIPSALVFGKDAPIGLAKKLRDTPANIQKIYDANKKASCVTRGVSAASIGTFAATTLPQNVVGLTIFVLFADDPETPVVPVAKLKRFLNEEGYSDDGNSGSVYDYFNVQSNGKLKLKQIAPDRYVRLDSTRAYYNGIAKNSSDQTLFVQHVLAAFQTQCADFIASADFQTLTQIYMNSRVLSIFYSGNSIPLLWPHRGGGLNTTINGIRFHDYQMSFIGNAPTLGIFCHETTHLVCDLVDYYNTQTQASALGGHSPMATGLYNNNSKSPADFTAYLKYRMGWITPIEITSATKNLTLTTLDPSKVYIYKNPNAAKEYFLIENRYVADSTIDPYRYYLPNNGRGIAIWHIDQAKSGNNEPQMTATQHFECSLEQADGFFTLEKQSGEVGYDYYCDNPASKTAFTPTTTPNSNWWNGSNSGLLLANLNGPAPTVTASLLTPPVFSKETTVISGDISVAIASPTPGVRVYYTLDGTTPTVASIPYTGPVTIPATRTTTLSAACCDAYGGVIASQTYIVNPDTFKVISPVGKVSSDKTFEVGYQAASTMTLYFILPSGKKWTVYTAAGQTVWAEPSGLTTGIDPPYKTWCRFTEYPSDTALVATSYFEYGRLQNITVASSKILLLQMNETSQITATKGVSGTPLLYASDNWDVATVSDVGLITAKNPGTARIIMTQLGSGEYLSADPAVVTVEVISPVFAKIAGSATATKDGILLNYDTVTQPYSIWRSESENGTYMRIQTGFMGGAYTDSQVVPGKTYFYKLSAE